MDASWMGHGCKGNTANTDGFGAASVGNAEVVNLEPPGTPTAPI